jgi:hypothetical protein
MELLALGATPADGVEELPELGIDRLILIDWVVPAPTLELLDPLPGRVKEPPPGRGKLRVGLLWPVVGRPPDPQEGQGLVPASADWAARATKARPKDI